eukprot:gene208-4454_t
MKETRKLELLKTCQIKKVQVYSPKAKKKTNKKKIEKSKEEQKYPDTSKGFVFEESRFFENESFIVEKDPDSSVESLDIFEDQVDE